MNSDFEKDVRSFLATLGPRSQLDLGGLEALLSPRELEAVKKVVEEHRYQELAAFLRDVSSAIARLQLLIGLERGTITEQVRQLVLCEMSSRGWEWSDGRVKQVPLSEVTGVSSAQINRFLRGGESGVVMTTTLDRISNVVNMRLFFLGEQGVIRREFQKQGPKVSEEAFPSGTVTEQVRQELLRVIARWGWSQTKLAKWSGVGQAQISRFLRGGAIKTEALDHLGALLWVDIRLVDQDL